MRCRCLRHGPPWAVRSFCPWCEQDWLELEPNGHEEVDDER